MREIPGLLCIELNVLQNLPAMNKNLKTFILISDKLNNLNDLYQTYLTFWHLNRCDTTSSDLTFLVFY